MTLSPAGPARSFTFDTFFCVGCGSGASADLVLNWLLFVPGGALLAVRSGALRAIVLSLAFSGLIEIVQIGIPSRDPVLQDLLANTLGGATGAVLAKSGLSRPVRGTLLALASFAWLSPTLLLLPTTAGTALLVQWTPQEAEDRYDGRVLEASVGGLPLRPGLAEDPSQVDDTVHRRAEIRLTLRAGGPSERHLTVLRVTDIHAHDIVDLAVLGRDLVFRGKVLATDLRLAQPATRWEGAMENVVADDSVEIVLERGRGSVCASIDDRSACGIAPPLSSGWGLLMGLDEAPGWLRALLTLAWAGGIGGLIGLGTRSCARALAFAAVLGTVGLVAAALSPDVVPDPVSPLLLVLGGGAGRLFAQSRTVQSSLSGVRFRDKGKHPPTP